MNRKISIIGGDLRIVKLAKLLQNEEYQIKTYGLENSNEIIIKNNSIEECLENSEIIISSIPFSKDEKYIYAPLAQEKIEIWELFYKTNKMCKNCAFVAGKIPKQVVKLAQQLEIQTIDILEDESLTIMNAIPSAEGAIQVAMEQSERTIHGSKILVMGFGRIGKILSKMLNGIGAKVYCEARKKEDLAWIKAYGYKSINLEELENQLNEFDFIFNTIPFIILKEQQLKKIKKDCLIIDLASNPGGVDVELAKQIGIKTIWALGLPGKVAPETAAEYIKQLIIKI